MRLTSNIMAKNSTGEQVWAVTKYGYRSRHNRTIGTFYRARAGALLAMTPADPGRAEAAYRMAIETARAQGACTYELQAAVPLAKLLQTNNRPLEAYDALARALEGFAPTPELPQIAEAQALLATLESPRNRSRRSCAPQAAVRARRRRERAIFAVVRRRGRHCASSCTRA